MIEQQTAPLDHYLEPLLAHRKVLLAVWVLVIALGVGAGMAAPVTYSSTAAILVYPSSSDPAKALESDDTKIDMPTELRIATSQAVVNLVLEQLQSQGIGATTSTVSDNITASTTKESTILDLTFVAATPQVAAAGANAFAEAYLDFRAELAANNKLSAESAINARITLLQDRLGDVESRFSRPGNGDVIILASEKATIETDLEAQQIALGALSTPTIDATVIIDQAVVPDAPEGLGLVQIIVGAVAGGLVIGVAATFVVSAFVAGRRTRDAKDPDGAEPAIAESTAHEPTTPETTRLEAAAAETMDAVPAAEEPIVRPEPLQDRRSSYDEDQGDRTEADEDRTDSGERAMVASGDIEPVIKYLQSVGATGPVTALSVGERDAESATAVTLGLADALQTLGARVLVVDACLSAPTVDTELKIPRGPGLVDVLSGIKTLRDAARQAGQLEGLDVLTVGNVTRQSVSLIRAANLERLLAEAKMNYHSILIVGGPLDEGVIIRTIASLTDGVVVGTDRGPGQLADPDLQRRLATLPAPTLELLSARSVRAQSPDAQSPDTQSPDTQSPSSHSTGAESSIAKSPSTGVAGHEQLSAPSM